MRLYTKHQLNTKMISKPQMNIKNNELTVTIEYGWTELECKYLRDIIRFCKTFNIKLNIVSWDDILAHDVMIEALLTYSNISIKLRASGLKRHPSFKRMKGAYHKLRSFFQGRVFFKVKAISGFTYKNGELHSNTYIRPLKSA